MQAIPDTSAAKLIDKVAKCHMTNTMTDAQLRRRDELSAIPEKQRAASPSLEAEKKRQKHGLDQVGEGNLTKLSQYCGLISSPLAHAPLIPDSVVVFGNGENINHIIQAITYEGENYPTSTFEGFGETCIKGGLVPFITGVPQIVIPGMGDRTFSGVYDYEIAIGIPANLLFVTVQNLLKSGGRLNLGSPVRTLLPTGITENITPGFKYMRQKIDEHKQR
jgi:hypothetical protein